MADGKNSVYKIYAEGKVSALVCVAELDTVRAGTHCAAAGFHKPDSETQEFPIVSASGDVAARAASLARLSSSPRCTTARGIQQNICLEGAWSRTLPHSSFRQRRVQRHCGEDARPNMTKLIRELRRAPPHRLSLLRRPPWLQNTAP